MAAFKLTRPVIAEHPLQVQLTSILRKELGPPGRVSAAGVVWFAVDHADYGGAVPAARIDRGIVAGLPDTFIIWRGIAHTVELKREGGSLQDSQIAVSAALLLAGGKVGFATTAEEYLGCLDSWGIPRARRVRLAA